MSSTRARWAMLFVVGMLLAAAPIAGRAVLAGGRGGVPDSYAMIWEDSDEGACGAEWIEIGGTGLQLDIDGDDRTYEVLLGFDFPFYGQFYDRVWVGSNGALSFGHPRQAHRPDDICLPDEDLLDPMIAVFWDDLVCEQAMGEAIWFQVFGGEPDLLAVIQFHVRPYGAAPDTPFLDFQVQLSQQGTISMVYQSMEGWPSGRGGSATVGIQGDAGWTGTTYLCAGEPKENAIHDGVAVCFRSVATVYLTPQRLRQAGAAGGGVLMPLRLHNKSELDDTYDVYFEGATWPAQVLYQGIPVEELGPVPSGQWLSFDLAVDVPEDALPGDFDEMVLRVVSQTAPQEHWAAADVVVTQGEHVWTRLEPLEEGRAGGAVVRVGGMDYWAGGARRYGHPAAQVWRRAPAEFLWSPVGDPDPEPFSAPAIAALEAGKILFLGGFSYEISDRVRAFDVSAETWETMEQDPLPEPRLFAAAAGIGDVVYLMGGVGPDGGPTTDCFAFDFSQTPGARWSARAPMSVARADHAAVVLDGKIYVAGGRDAEGRELDAFEVYDPALDYWTTLPPLPWAASGLALVAIPASPWFQDGDLIVAIAGGEQPRRRVAAYRPGAAEWEEWPALAQRRTRPVAAAFTDRIFVFGGLDGAKVLDEIEVMLLRPERARVELEAEASSAAAPPGSSAELLFRLTNETGEQGSFTLSYEQLEWPHTGPDSLGPLAPGEQVIFAVNVDVPEETPWFARDEWRLRAVSQAVPDLEAAVDVSVLSGGAWEERASLPVPLGWAAAVGDGERLFVLGGEDDQAASHLLIYDEQADAWTEGPPPPIPVSNAPAVLLDGRIYLLAGYKFAEYQPSYEVQIYDPATGEWQLSGQAYPGAGPIGAAAVAVPEDRVIIYLGGASRDLQVTGEVWRFDPDEGWSPLPPLAQPRLWAGAVLHDRQVLVAGGWTDGGPLDSSEVLDLDDPAWTPGPALEQPVFAAGWGLDRDVWLLTAGAGTLGAERASWVLTPLGSGFEEWSPWLGLPGPGRYQCAAGVLTPEDERYLHLVGGWDADGGILMDRHLRIQIGPPEPTPTASPSFTPSFTPAPTASPTEPPPSPTPAATSPPTLGVELTMPATHYRPGDPCWLTALVGNPGEPLADTPLVVFLDIGIGEFWFWPNWAHYPPDIDFREINVPTGISPVEIIPEFTWPSDVGEMDGLVFWGALVDPGFTTVLGEIGSWRFSYGN